MKNNYTTSENGINLIIEFEAEILKVYKDPVGLPTLGVGHLLTGAEKVNYKVGQKITRAESRKFLRQDLRIAENAINEEVQVPITQNQFDALVSLAFNIGVAGFRRSSVLRNLNNRHFQAAANAILAWNKANGKALAGLTRRRKAERLMFLTPDKISKSVSTDTRAAAASADVEPIDSAQQSVEAAENSINASPPIGNSADNSEDNSNANQTADTIVNTGNESGDARKIEAAGDAPPVSVPTPPATGFLGKLGATIGGLFTGSIVLPPFVEKVFSGEVSQGLIDLIKFVFPYLFFGAIGGLIVWFVAKKLNNFHLTRLFVETNTDMTKKDIVFTPALETKDTKTLNL